MKKLFTLFCILISAFANAQTHVVISQIYGGGGNAGAALKNDFIELYNPTALPVDLSTYSVQYTSAAGVFTGTGATAITPLTGSIGAGKYYLIQEAQGGAGTVNLPTPDASGTINMSGTTGKVLLASVQTAIGGTGCPMPVANVVDFVGYGTANCFEGATVAPATSNTTSDSRNAANTDTDNNGVDFTAGAPNPRNSLFGTLPIILQNFTANKSGNNTELHWLVDCLSTSVTFELQRSVDALNFQTFYTSSETKARCAAPFNYTDANALNGKNFYRLKIIDVDGKISYSNIVFIISGTGGKGLLSIRPTIVSSQADVYYTSANAEKIQWTIIDIQGRIVKKVTTPVTGGENKLTIPTSDLPSGQYQLKGLTSAGSTAVVKFMKQ